MEFEARRNPEALEVRITGRWEFTDHDRMRDIVVLFDQPGLRRVVLDLADLSFIDSARLRMLLILQEEAEQTKIALTVRGPREEVRRSLELARLGEIITIEY